MGLRWGIIGTGGIARTFAQDLTFTDHRVVAVGSRTQQGAESFELAERRYGSYEELVSDGDVDAVYIATPHAFHRDNALLAIGAGKHVLVEKAFTLNTRQAREIMDAARSQNVAVLEAMWTRFLPHIATLREIIASGEIGDVLSIIADHGQSLPRSKAERLWAPELGGGALLDLGVYPISFAHMILGKPDSIVSSATLTDEGVDSQVSAALTYRNGAHASVHATMLVQTSNTAVVSGTRGRIELSSRFYSPTDMRVFSAGTFREIPHRYEGVGHREQALAFEKIIKDGRRESELMSHQQTLDVMETMDLIREQCGVRYAVD